MELTERQIEAINETKRNLQIVACAGSGKTEVISRRIANILLNVDGVAPENIVAFTFTNKAAVSMKKRIAKAVEGTGIDIDKMKVSTIHSFCYDLISSYSEKFKGFKILDNAKNYLFLRRYYNKCGMKSLALNCSYHDIMLFRQCIDKMVDDYSNMDTWSETNREVFNKYRECLYSNKCIDFSFMIIEALIQIDTTDSVKEYIRSVKYLVVDEYQDVNDIQEQLISRIVDAGANICVVGDDDQTIYAFRGSNSDNMITFSERYDNVHQVKLEQNFRSTSGIVDVAETVIRNNSVRLDKTMFSKKVNNNSELMSIGFNDRDTMYEFIAQKAIELKSKGIDYSDMAILVRKGKRIPIITNVLTKKGIPCQTDSSSQVINGKYFVNLFSTIEILTELDKKKLSDIWSDEFENDKITNGFKYLRKCLNGTHSSMSEIISGFCQALGYDSSEVKSKDTRVSEYNAILTILKDFDTIYGDCQLNYKLNELVNFFAYNVEEVYKNNSFNYDNYKGDAIHILTVHKSKGLEFNTVFIPDLCDREFPVGKMGGRKYWHVLGENFAVNKDKYDTDITDERKLFYVAVTRAKENLYLISLMDGQNISCFVSEASKSYSLNTDEEVLDYDDHAEKERQKEKEYWQLVTYAKDALFDYYGTACHFFPGARSDLIRIKSLTPDELITEAQKNHLI